MINAISIRLYDLTSITYLQIPIQEGLELNNAYLPQHRNRLSCMLYVSYFYSLSIVMLVKAQICVQPY